MALEPSGIPSRAAIQDAIDEATAEASAISLVIANGDSMLVVEHGLGHTPAVGFCSVTAFGYQSGFAAADDTTATFWVTNAAGAAQPGGSFLLTWLVK